MIWVTENLYLKDLVLSDGITEGTDEMLTDLAFMRVF